MENDFLIERKLGKQNFFKVPDGYFDGLVDSVGRNIDRAEASVPAKKIRLVKFRRIACAACFVAVAACVAAYWAVRGGSVAGDAEAVGSDMAVASYSDVIIDEMSDYAMLDNDDFYSFIAEEQ